jgi:membrane protease YdiL (CAAX protease family)
VPWPLMGFGVYRLANFSGISIPFDFKSLELVFMLLLIAPILEELIFRFALWELVDDLIQNKEIQIWISAILFSVGHLITIFMISPDFRPFVLYQAMYVIILSIGAAKMRQESKGIIGSILVHFFFNFGFYLASLF